jgi:hypothetical protein
MDQAPAIADAPDRTSMPSTAADWLTMLLWARSPAGFMLRRALCLRSPEQGDP